MSQDPDHCQDCQSAHLIACLTDQLREESARATAWKDIASQKDLELAGMRETLKVLVSQWRVDAADLPKSMTGLAEEMAYTQCADELEVALSPAEPAKPTLCEYGGCWKKAVMWVRFRGAGEDGNLYFCDEHKPDTKEWPKPPTGKWEAA